MHQKAISKTLFRNNKCFLIFREKEVYEFYQMHNTLRGGKKKKAANVSQVLAQLHNLQHI